MPRLVFIDGECGNLKVVVDGGQLLRSFDKKEEASQQMPTLWQMPSSISIRNIMNKLVKHDFSCG